MRTNDDFRRVKKLLAEGLSDYRAAQVTGVPRSTVLRWRNMDMPPGKHAAGADLATSWEVHDAAAYCYLLGCYLGDGHLIHRPPNGWALRIAADQQYDGIAREIIAAIETTFPGRAPSRFASSSGASDVIQVSHPAVARAFPQHGPGHKHLRRIELAGWQLALTRAEPGALIRGLIHSDGCRVVNRFRTTLPSGRVAEYAYVRYFFSNLSSDIRRIFADHCQLLGIRVTQSNHRNLAVSHRHSVAILDSFVGPKH